MVSVEEMDSVSDPAILEDDTADDEAGEWRELMGSDLLMKVVQVDDSEGTACDVGDAVVVDFVGRKASTRDDTDGPVFHDASDWLVVVGDKEVVPALEMAIRFLRVGEHAQVFSHSKYAYGPMGRTHGSYELPPSSSVVYTVHVKRIEKDASAMQIARSKKLIGNDCYQNEWFGGHGKIKALKLYKRAADTMNNVVANNPDDKEAFLLLVDCLNNVAAVHMRAKEYGKAKEAATQVLLHDPDNLKALCRAARAAMVDPGGTYEESDAAIGAAEKVAPDDVEVKKLRLELGRRKKEYKKKSKALYAKMMSAEKSNVESVAAKETLEAKSMSTQKWEGWESWFRKYLPYLIQLVLPFVMYGIFLLVGGKSRMEHFERALKDAQKVDSPPEPESEF